MEPPGYHGYGAVQAEKYKTTRGATAQRHAPDHSR